ncbi:MAG: serine/threonine protein kinase [Myxococcales bacterium]|nr:serine/threonine protein kinase [Myxococcales bacterium]
METAARRIGRYRVVGALGTGAMGEVLRAHDERLGRDVAIKRVKNLLGVMSASFHARFEAEARALAALAHPGVVQVFDLGVEDGEPYLVLELIEGPTLRAVIAERGALPAAEVCALGIQLARALEAAHARGIVHRDVKPANVLRGPGGLWKLADFGVAHIPDSEATLAGQFLGTPAYAAPEALTLGQFSPASDVYGLAATLYEAATGDKPRGDATMAELIAQADRPVIAPDAIPAHLGELGPTLAAALAVSPAARPSAAELAERLAGTASTQPRAAATTPATTPATTTTAATATPPTTTTTAGGAPTRAMAAPAPPTLTPAVARARLPRWAPVAGGVVLAVGVLALVDRLGRAPGDPPAAGVTPAVLPALGGEVRTPDDPLTFAAPALADDKARKDWRKVAERIHAGELGGALRRLDEFERKHGASAESARLRAWLERQPLDDERGRGPRGRGRARGD